MMNISYTYATFVRCVRLVSAELVQPFWSTKEDRVMLAIVEPHTSVVRILRGDWHELSHRGLENLRRQHPPLASGPSQRPPSEWKDSRRLVVMTAQNQSQSVVTPVYHKASPEKTTGEGQTN